MSSPIFGPVPSTAAIVWSDDFNDGNYDEWAVHGLLFYEDGSINETEGSFSATDNTLRATGEPTDEGSLWNYADHPSSIAYGTWSLDVYVTKTPGAHFYIWFMINEWASFKTISAYGYDIMIEPRAYHLLKRVGGDTEFLDTSLHDPFSGWVHIDITRDTEGQFYVYINGTRQLEAMDTETITSTHFRFGTEAGPALDNIIVSDTVVDITSPAETPITTPTETSITNSATSTPIVREWLMSGIGVPVILVVIGVVGKRKRRKGA